jgi:RimJ/RimL family protein N-acetyltransferase
MNESWIKHPTILTGNLVELIPLEEEHFDELYKAASDKKLWEFIPTDGSVHEKFLKGYNASLADREKGMQYPFVIKHKETGKLIGSTRFIDIVPADSRLEIGFTWITQPYWGTAINFECKLLLMTFSFETLKAVRVQLKTDENNIRSRTAIQKIGGKFEGILRKDRLRDNGTYRNSAYYSILDTEWEEAKKSIIKQMEERKRNRA